MKKRLTSVFILALVIAMAACSSGERKAAKTAPISEKEAKVIVLEQARAEKDDEREVELVSLTDIGGIWFSLICFKEGGGIIVEDGYLREEEGAYVYHGFNDVVFCYEKEKAFFDSSWSREIDGKTIYVSISRQVIVNELAHWHSGAHRVNDNVEIHYNVEWD